MLGWKFGPFGSPPPLPRRGPPPFAEQAAQLVEVAPELVEIG
jgi:hypothetical protein